MIDLTVIHSKIHISRIQVINLGLISDYRSNQRLISY